MEDLISRKALIEELTKRGVNSKLVTTVINYQPTAYDKEKVVEQLDDYLFEKYCIEGENEVEKIVKAGGVNE